MSGVQRIGIFTIVFALVLYTGSAIGIIFFLKAPSQSDDSISDTTRELGLDAPTRSTRKADMIAVAPNSAATVLANAQQNIFESSRPGETIRPIGQADTVETATPRLGATVSPG